MSEYNQPEEYYRANGFTRLRAGAGPHLGQDANLSFDLVEKSETVSAQPEAVDGQLKCYQRIKTTLHLFTWRLNPETRKFSKVSDRVTETRYGPLVEVACPKALVEQFGSTPEPIDEEKVDPCPEEDQYGTEGKVPDDFYADLFSDSQVRVAQRTVTAKGQVDLLEVDFFHYAKQKTDSGDRCYARKRHIKTRLHWTLCPGGDWHLHDMSHYVNLWGPWYEIPCHTIPRDTIIMPLSDR